MFSYFVPITLLVLAGFALGLLVGRMTWVSSKERADQEPAEHETAADGLEPTPTVEPATTLEPAPTHEPAPTVEPAPSVPDRLVNWSVIRDQAPDWSPSELPFWQMQEVSAWTLPDARISPSDVEA